ncbi:MAG TPA: carboxypeptidase-like regulatory domain-containing protein [Pyrinomonadaceae bacterium]
MASQILAVLFSHPFFAISDVYGRYEIRGVPPGTYEIVAWHPKAGRQEMEIT